MADQQGAGETGGSLLFLTDEQLRKGIEAMFFAYRGFTADPDRILEDHAYGRAHHRAVHFVNRAPGTTVNNIDRSPRAPEKKSARAGDGTDLPVELRPRMPARKACRP
jgi:hypothetical protein